MPAYLPTLAAVLLAPFGALAQPAGPIAVPSGQQITLLDRSDEGALARFRFLAPAIARVGGTVDFASAEGDMLFLCEEFALPQLSSDGKVPARVVIALLDRPVTLGEADPAATQFIEAYRPEGRACIWEGF